MTQLLRFAPAARLAPLIVVASLAGCGSVITFSNVSREQGTRYLQAGMDTEAEGAFADAVTQNPRDYQSHYYLGVLYDKKKQYVNALAHFKTALDVQPTTVQGAHDDAFRVKILTAQADTMAKISDNDRTVNDLEAEAAHSTTGEEAFQLAHIFAGRGDADSAVTAYNQAAIQAPDKFYIVKAQALYLTKQGLKPQAEAALRRAYQLNDQDQDVQNALRSLGIVPGPSLKDPDQLKKPLLPTGPLPDWINRNRQPAAPTGDVPADTK